MASPPAKTPIHSLLLLFLCSFSVLSNGLPVVAGSSSVLDRVQAAMKITQQSVVNITAAHEACDLWEDILSGGSVETSLSDPKIRSICLALQASCLVRVGDDQRALSVYDSALALCQHDSSSPSEQIEKLCLGKAKSLQRLLRYSEAVDQFQRLSSQEGAVGAATCALRQGKFHQGREILERYLQGGSDDSMIHVKAMLAALSFDKSLNATSSSDTVLPRLRAAAGISPVYRWLYSRLVAQGFLESSDKQDNVKSSFSFIDYCAVNVDAFDDPLLVHLDDKILLHRLLTSSTENRERSNRFWPEGVVVGSANTASSPSSRQWKTSETGDSLYFLKKRAGYGSHGNSIVSGKKRSFEQASKMLSEMSDGDLSNEILVQKMVDPPLLLHGGRKFSLRVYVVLLPADRDESPFLAFISNQGLVKFAAKAVHSEDSLSRKHMTNSGREAQTEQGTFDLLREALLSSSSPPGDSSLWLDLWDCIVEATRDVLDGYRRHSASLESNNSEFLTMRQTLAKLGLPKILGFDWVIDGDHKPWLVEVNRFPGLEPRDSEQDSAVKHHIMRDAWGLSVERAQEKNELNGAAFAWLESDLGEFPAHSNSLQQLDFETTI